jgi:Tat protein translocase TatC
MSAPDGQETFISHLIEMRNRLLRAVLAVVVIFVLLFPWAQDLYALLAEPMLASLPQGGQMIATEVTTPFFVPVKVTMMTAFLIALPWIFYQIWAFVAPGLYQHEKRWACRSSSAVFCCSCWGWHSPTFWYSRWYSVSLSASRPKGWR